MKVTLIYNKVIIKEILKSIAKLSPNVLGIRRSSPPYSALRSNAVGWNVVEQNATKAGFSPATGVLRNPSRPNGRRSVYRLLGDGFAIHHITFLFQFFLQYSLKKTFIFFLYISRIRFEDGFEPNKKNFEKNVTPYFSK